MLQKLLIAFCTLFLLSACGGSSNNSAPTPTEPPSDNQDNDNDDDDSDSDDDGSNDDDDSNEDDNASTEWLNITFDDASDEETWSYLCVSAECNAAAEIEHNAEAAALDVTPTWAAAGEQIEVSTTIDPEIADLTDGYAHLNLFVPESYTEAGDMVVQVFFQDASDRKAYIGYRTAATDWNTFYFENIQLGTGDNDPFGYFDDGFNLANINRVGVQLQAAEGQIALDDTLRIDDVIISPEAIDVESKNGDDETSEPTDLNFTFEEGIDGWHIDGTGDTTTQDTDNLTLSHDADNSALVITPKSWAAIEENWNYQSRVEVPVTDLSSATVRVEVDIPEAYISDGSLTVQFATSGGGSWTDAPGALQAGMNTIDFDLSAVGEDITEVATIGIQLKTAPADTDLKESISVHSITVYEDGEAPALPGDETPVEEEPTNAITVDMTSGWRVNPDTITWDYTTDGVFYEPTAANDQLVFDPAGPLDMRDGSIDFVYEVDQAFIDSGANLQPFFQLKDYASNDFHFCWIGNGDLETGEKTYTCDVPAALDGGNAAQIPDGETAQVGVHTNGGGAGTVTIKSVTINPAE